MPDANGKIASRGQDSEDWLANFTSVHSALSHNLRNALSIVRGNAQLVGLLTGQEEKASLAVERIITAVDGITEILDEMQCLRRPPADEATPFDLAEIVTEALSTVEPLAEEKKVRCPRSVLLEAMVMGFPRLMHQALVHLMRNGIEAMQPGGTLIVGMTDRSNEVSVSVTDSGPGIPLKHHRMVFTQFFSTKATGHGWGLVTVDRVVRLVHGGRVCFATSAQGTCFTVTVPKTQESALS